MLKDKLTLALKKLEQKNVAVNKQRNSLKYATNVTNTKLAVSQIRRLISIYSAAINQNLLEKGLSEEVLGSLLNALDQCKQELSRNDLEDVTVRDTEFAQRLLTNEMHNAWIGSAAVSKGKQSQVFLEAFGSFVVDSTEAKKVAAALANAVKSLPLNVQQVNSFSLNIEKAIEMANSSGLNDEIKEYIKKAQDKTATIGDLTPSILNWARQNGVADKFKVMLE